MVRAIRFVSLLVAGLAIAAQTSALRPKPSASSKAMVHAIVMSDVATVRKLLHAGVKASGDPTYRLFIVEAAGRGNIEIARMLLANGADVNAMSRSGSALTMAAFMGDVPMGRFLISKGAKVNQADRIGTTPLTMSWHYGFSKMLVEHGADVNAALSDGMSCLMCAVSVHQPKIVELLLAHGARIEARDHGGCTAVFYACWDGQRSSGNERTLDLESIRMLVHAGANVHAADSSGDTPLSIASGDSEMLSLLVTGR